MIIVKIPNIEITQYNAVMDVLSSYPFYVVNQCYLSKLKIGIFWFQDRANIPSAFYPFIVPSKHLNFTERFTFNSKIQNALELIPSPKPKKKSKTATKRKEV